MHCLKRILIGVILKILGVITAKALLPITRLNFGHTEIGFGSHTLGRLECFGQVSFTEQPTACFDLWKIGHTLSGFYVVKGEQQMKTVFCNMSAVPGNVGKTQRLVIVIKELM